MGYSHLEIRLGKSGYHQHSCDRQFGSSSLSDLVGSIYKLNRGKLSLVGTPHVMDVHLDLCSLYSHNNLSLLSMT